MSERARLLVFGFSDEEQARIDEALVAAGAPPATRIHPAQSNQVLAEILRTDQREAEPPPAAQGGQESAWPARETAPGSAPGEEEPPLVLFHNVSDPGMAAIMRLLRQLPVPRPIFAVPTPTSIGWTLRTLVEHLLEEQRAFEARKRAGGGA